ncbi:MAG: tetratricopeptide repeat protein [bacterium]|nr:tetratricopeptide repeat protein [bacterium]
MIKRFRDFLGPARAQALFLLFGFTGAFSLILNAVEGEWVVGAQNALVLIFIAGAALIIGTKLDRYERGRWLGLLAPAAGAVVIGVLFLPQYLLLLMGLAFGWIVAGLFLLRPRGSMQYQQAIKHLRKNEYSDAAQVMDGLIKDEPRNPNHYRFRAEILRLWGKLDRARRDYEKMIELAPGDAVGHNGLAEVHLQAGRYDAARRAAQKALELAPDEWVAAYNLGMIEDRLKESQAAVGHLHQALTLKVPDARHRLLIQLYLVRAYSRMGNVEAAEREVEALIKQRAGLQEWKTLLESEQAETLRQVIAADIETAEALIEGRLSVTALSQQTTAKS